MKIGFSLPNIGPIGTADAITKVAQRAEALGYSSLWTIERLLYPLKLQRPYPGTPDGHLPEIYKQVLDPLDALTYVAAQTKRIRLGTSVLDMPYHNRSSWRAGPPPSMSFPTDGCAWGWGLAGAKMRWMRPAPT